MAFEPITLIITSKNGFPIHSRLRMARPDFEKMALLVMNHHDSDCEQNKTLQLSHQAAIRSIDVIKSHVLFVAELRLTICLCLVRYKAKSKRESTAHGSRLEKGKQ